MYIAVSLDGYIADKDGGVGWLDPYFSPEIDFAGFMKTIGITVMGRVTYDWAVAHGHAGDQGRCMVLTHRPLDDPPRGMESFGGDVRELAARLQEGLAGTGKDIWLMGGGQSIAPFHEAGLVDRWELSIIPVLLGDGIPLFPKHTRGLEGLRLTHSRTLKNGIVEVRYEPQQPGA
ncbi:MAG TPA: dihydrofolate reductase family protein [Phycisphaerae bacterium]